MLRREHSQIDYRPAGWTEPGEGPTVAIDALDSQTWLGVGRRLYQGRKQLQISKREAARRAGISETLWRHLEDGGKTVGGKVILPNPRPENLYAAAKAVNLTPETLFAFLGQDMPEGLTREVFDDRLAHKIAHLSDRDRMIVEQLVDSMLRLQEHPTPLIEP